LVDNNRQGAEKLYIGEAPTPRPDEGEVLVKVYLSTLICVLI
jgi:NADPH:quinone reductase-like Zn-dependent oxidoreductase